MQYNYPGSLQFHPTQIRVKTAASGRQRAVSRVYWFYCDAARGITDGLPITTEAALLVEVGAEVQLADKKVEE